MNFVMPEPPLPFGRFFGISSTKKSEGLSLIVPFILVFFETKVFAFSNYLHPQFVCQALITLINSAQMILCIHCTYNMYTDFENNTYPCSLLIFSILILKYRFVCLKS